jgi:shikimate O-hydroxycinnamoyltransferase
MAKLRRTLILDKRIRSGVTVPKQHLTGIDILHSHVGLPKMWVFKKGFDVALAERALGETLKHYPLVAGRMKKDTQGQVFIEGNDAGIDFRVYRCKGPLPYGEHNPIGDDIKQFYEPLMMPWQVIGRDTPFLQVAVHEFDDGGILMSTREVHSVFDGTSIIEFLLNWSKVCRGQSFTPCSFERGELIKAGQTDIDTTGFDVYRPFSSIGHSLSLLARFAWRSLTDMENERFRIPADVIQGWKTQARADLPATAKISTGKLLTAYVLRAISPQMPHGVPRKVGMPMDMRFISGSPVPRNYFGNALHPVGFELSEDDLAQKSLAELAEQCSPSPDQLTPEMITKCLTLVERFRQKKALWKLMNKHGVDTLDAGIIINNVSLLPIYDIDLGRGPTDWFETWAMPNRMMMLFSTPAKDGGIDLSMSARRAEMSALRKQLTADGIIQV